MTNEIIDCKEQKKALFISFSHGWNKRYKMFMDILSNLYDYHVLSISSDFNHVTKKKIEQFKPDIKYIHVSGYKKNLSVMRIVSLIQFSIKCKKEINKYQPQLLYIIIPPNSLGEACKKYLCKNKNCVFILDIIDLWPESLPMKKVKKTFIYLSWQNMRNKSLDRANLVLTECDLYHEPLKSYVQEEHIKTLHLFKNQSQNEIESINERCVHYCCVKEVIKLAYLGSINHIIDIDMILMLIKGIQKKGFTVDISIVGDGERKERFIETLNSQGCIVNYYGIVYDQNKLASIMCNCDYGLNIMTDAVVVGLTMKSIDYFSFGLPIINNILGDTWSLVEKYNIGVNITREGDPAYLVDFICARKQSKERVLEVFHSNFSEEGYKNKVSLILSDLLK